MPGNAAPQTGTSNRSTLQDVAREAGVGLATADHVFNQRPGVRPSALAPVGAAA